MKKLILKITIIATLVVVCSFCLMACESRIDRELREMEETHNAISEIARDMGIKLPDFGDTSGAVTVMPDAGQSNESSLKSNYTLFPAEIITGAEVNLNKHIGNRYYVHALPFEIDFYNIGNYYFELYYLVILEHDGLAEMEDEDVLMEHVLSVSIIGNESDAGWSEIDFFSEYMFYFEYLGYDDVKDQHIGKYEYHELYDPWE